MASEACDRCDVRVEARRTTARVLLLERDVATLLAGLRNIEHRISETVGALGAELGRLAAVNHDLRQAIEMIRDREILI